MDREVKVNISIERVTVNDGISIRRVKPSKVYQNDNNDIIIELNFEKVIEPILREHAEKIGDEIVGNELKKLNNKIFNMKIEF